MGRKNREEVWVLGFAGDPGVVIVPDALSDDEVWVSDKGARDVEVEIRGRTVKRKEVLALLISRKEKYDEVEFPNGAKVHVRRREAATC